MAEVTRNQPDLTVAQGALMMIIGDVDIAVVFDFMLDDEVRRARHFEALVLDLDAE